jgi:Spy/CpxP family protein refolding chaperone
MRTRLANELRLDAAQRSALDTILDTRNRVYDDLVDPIRPQLDSVGTDARQQIRQLLTPEQLAIYDKMQAERDAARRQEKKQ